MQEKLKVVVCGVVCIMLASPTCFAQSGQAAGVTSEGTGGNTVQRRSPMPAGETPAARSQGIGTTGGPAATAGQGPVQQVAPSTQ